MVNGVWNRNRKTQPSPSGPPWPWFTNCWGLHVPALLQKLLSKAQLRSCFELAIDFSANISRVVKNQRNKSEVAKNPPPWLFRGLHQMEGGPESIKSFWKIHRVSSLCAHLEIPQTSTILINITNFYKYQLFWLLKKSCFHFPTHNFKYYVRRWSCRFLKKNIFCWILFVKAKTLPTYRNSIEECTKSKGGPLADFSACTWKTTYQLKNFWKRIKDMSHLYDIFITCFLNHYETALLC